MTALDLFINHNSSNVQNKLEYLFHNLQTDVSQHNIGWWGRISDLDLILKSQAAILKFHTSLITRQLLKIFQHLHTNSVQEDLALDLGAWSYFGDLDLHFKFTTVHLVFYFWMTIPQLLIDISFETDRVM